MLCKVILRTVHDSEKSHEVFLNGGSTLQLMNPLGMLQHGSTWEV